MAFTACTTGTVALYQRDDESMLAVPVEAWDDKGVPYVAGTVALVEATTPPGFLRLEQEATALPPTARQGPAPIPSGPARGRRPKSSGPREREGA